MCVWIRSNPNRKLENIKDSPTSSVYIVFIKRKKLSACSRVYLFSGVQLFFFRRKAIVNICKSSIQLIPRYQSQIRRTYACMVLLLYEGNVNGL